jgi:hypothetical protein
LEKVGSKWTLAEVLDLSFFGCRLRHNARFEEFGLPSDVDICVTELPPGRLVMVKVTLPDGRVLDLKGPRTSPVRHLKRLVAQELGRVRDDFEFENRDAPVDQSVTLGDIEPPELGIRLTRSEFHFDSVTGPISVSLPVGATVGHARTALANQLGQSEEAVKVLVNDLETGDDSQPLPPEGLSVSYLQTIEFEFYGKKTRLAVDFDLPVSRLKSTLVGRIERLPPPAAFSLYFGNSEMDEEMTINDLEPSPTDCITIVGSNLPRRVSSGPLAPVAPVMAPSPPPPAELDIRILLLLGVVPRSSRFKVSPETTAGQLYDEVRKKWSIPDDLDIEIVAGDVAEENWCALGRDEKLKNLDLANQDLAVRQPTAAVPGGDESGSIHRGTLSLGGTLKTSSEPEAAVDPNAMLFKFPIPQMEEDEKIFYFQPVQKVSDAKVTIAEKYGF